MLTASSINSIDIMITMTFLRLRKMPNTPEREQDRRDGEIDVPGRSPPSRQLRRSAVAGMLDPPEATFTTSTAVLGPRAT